MPNEEYKILEKLKEMRSIVIKKANNQSNIAILNGEDYNEEAMRQL